MTSQTAADDGNNMSDVDALVNQGINANHALLFGKGMDALFTSQLGDWNAWTGKGTPPRGGIEEGSLGEDGVQVVKWERERKGAEKVADRDGAESLAYLVDVRTEHDGKVAFEDVRGLLQVDEAGYYYYDSTKN